MQTDMFESYKKAVVVLSGGQDSTTCLYWARGRFSEIHAVTFNYGQRHLRELDAAANVAKTASSFLDSHEIISLGAILKGSSPLVSNNTLEQYVDHASLPGGLEKTFVPLRNQLFLTVAANRAFALGASVLITGVSQEDYGGYPDCRMPFIRTLEGAINAGTFTGEPGTLPPIRIETPLMSLSKAETVALALELEGCYSALSLSHTSYDGKYPPTGKDHATLLRAKGFELANVPDPLVLRAWKEGLMSLPESRNYHPDLVSYYQELL